VQVSSRLASRQIMTVDDLAPVDEFHIGGRKATEGFLDQLGFSAQMYALDVGSGLGGAARFAATRYGSRFTGIDLTAEYVETGNALTVPQINRGPNLTQISGPRRQVAVSISEVRLIGLRY
jgi:hypothetical protein